MRFANVMKTACALLLAGAPAAALSLVQQGTRGQESAGERPAGQERQKEAVPSTSEPAPEIEFGVIGLTKDNVEAVQRGLTSLTSQVYVCKGCGREYPKAGTCPQDKLELSPEKRQIFREVQPNLEQSNIRVKPESNATLRLSDIERALLAQSVRVEIGRFPVRGKATLVIRGGTGEDVAPIEKALEGSKAFEEVRVDFDPATSEILATVRSAAAKQQTMADLAAALKSTGSRVRLSDVVWGQPVIRG